MKLRVNPNPLPDLLAALSRTQEDEQEALLELSTGRRVNKPSDDPSAAAVLVANSDRTAEAAQYLHNLSNLRGMLQTADSTLNSMVTALERAITLGVQGANGTLSSSSRASLTEELKGIQNQLISLANLSFQGRYVFAGTESRTRPFMADPSVASGVRYDGNNGVNAVQIGDGFALPINRPGSQLFMGAGNDIFQSMNDLIQSMESGSGIDTAVGQLRQSFDYLAGQRVFYGNTVNQLDSQKSFLDNQTLALQQQENDLAGADTTNAVSRIVNSQNARDATLSAVGKALQSNLFDYLQ